MKLLRVELEVIVTNINKIKIPLYISVTVSRQMYR